MQRQKTIAKWIGVILLTTLCIACYFIINAIEAGTLSLSQNSASAQDTQQTQTPNEEMQEQIYSTLPREGYTYQNASVSHVGTSDNDTYLASVVYCEKLFVFFESKGANFDVKQEGLHIAIFGKNSTSNQFDLLLSTHFIANSTSKFLCASLSPNGIFALICQDSFSTAILIDEGGKICAKNTLSAYVSAKAYLLPNQLVLFASNESAIHYVEMESNLQYEKSNFIHSTQNAQLLDVFAYGEQLFLTAQSENCALALTFSVESGFKCVYEEQNTTILQTLPISTASQQSVLIAGLSSCVTLNLVSQNYKTASYAIESDSIYLQQQENKIYAITSDFIYTFCTHLDLMEKAQVQFDCALSSVQRVAGTIDLFVASTDKVSYLYKFQEQISLIFDFEKVVSNVSAVLSQNALSIIFEGNQNLPYCYATFGLNDVFLLSIEH